MVTILTPDDRESFIRRLDTTETIIIPILADDTAHPCDNLPSLVYIRFLDNGDEFVVPHNHSEVVSWPWTYNGNAYKFVPNRKEFRHLFPLSKVIDVNLLQYVDSGIPIDLKLIDTKAHTLIKRNYPKRFINVNRIIPLSKHIESCQVLSSKMLEVIEANRLNIDDPSFQFLNYNATDVFQQIESSGIHKDGKLVYSEYNLFTATGRPSNRFGGINFAALNKGDGTRLAYTSRFTVGMMILIDYDAYHLRLIANLIGYKFPPGNVHEFLGKMYFKTDTLTEEQYNESKRISFHMLYGSVSDEYRHIPFFDAVRIFVDYLWISFLKNKYIVSPIGQRKLYSKSMELMHSSKLFNYFIQLHETEHNVMTLEKVLPLFHERRSKLVLYTYDSILIDFHPEDGLDFIRKVKTALECENEYPAKVYVGSTYHELTNVTDRFQSL